MIAQRIYTDENNQLVIYFGDQTKGMGNALLTFSQEARLLAAGGQDPTPAENVVRIILRAFNSMMGEALNDLYPGSNLPDGFFVRDFVADGGNFPGARHPDWPLAWRQGVPTNYRIDSDFNHSDSAQDPVTHQPLSGQYTDAAMSLDQIAYMMNGWWAVTQYSTDAVNRATAQVQTERLMSCLMNVEYQLPAINGQAVTRGGGIELALSAGFISKIADQITQGTNLPFGSYFLRPDNITHITDIDFGGITGAIHDRVERWVQQQTASLAQAVKDLFNWDPAADVVNEIGNYLAARIVPGTIQVKLPVCIAHGLIIGTLNMPVVGSIVVGSIVEASFAGNLSLATLLPGAVQEILDQIQFNIPTGMTWVGPLIGGYPKVAVRTVNLGDLLNDVRIPVNSPISSFAKDLALVLMAHESDPTIAGPYRAMAMGSNNVWAALIQSAVQGLVVSPDVAEEGQLLQSQAPPTGPAYGGPNGWSSKDRWETGGTNEYTVAPTDGTRYNGIDFLSLETLLRSDGVEPA
jgi:hypothetical protein